jgi:hypothetical protein
MAAGINNPCSPRNANLPIGEAQLARPSGEIGISRIQLL